MKRMKKLFLAVGLPLTLCFFCKTGANQLHSCESRSRSRCGSFDGGMSCQCNDKCVKFNDCCTDFLQKCTRIHFAGAASLEGLVIVQEKTREEDVGYICHGGRWLTWEASAACAHLGYSNNGSSYSTDTSLNVSIPILHSYASCSPGARNLSQCTFTTNITTQGLCSTDSQVDCCQGLLGLTCIDDSDAVEKATVATAISTPILSTKTHSSTVSSSQSSSTTITKHSKINEGKNDMYIYIIIGVAVVLLLIIVALIVMVRFQRKNRQQLRDPPAFGSPLVTMGNVTSDQSEDTTPTPLLAHETLCVNENVYASDPTLPPSMPSMASDVDEHEYAYMDMPPIRSGTSEDPVHTYMDTEVSQVTSRPLTREQDDDGLIDNELYQTSN